MRALKPDRHPWDLAAARRLYRIDAWSSGYFDVDADGQVTVRPRRQRAGGEIALTTLVDRLAASGLSLPVLVRFPDILTDRLEALQSAFAQAAAQHDYAGGYTAAYPIKVNQQYAVVEQLTRSPGVGLEAGSKAELLAVLSVAPDGATIICNGYKDADYIRWALIGQQLGHRVFIVVEKPSELPLVIAASRELGIAPCIGLRARLATLGAGNWQNTGGEKSKFGLSATQLQAALAQLEAAGLLDHLQLLHFHMGSQLPDIADVHRGLQEACRFYAALRQAGAPMGYLDVGGGLGVDYEGTRSREHCSINYSLQEYASAIVRQVARACTEAELAPPHLITEAGRAMTAHHAVLITEVSEVEPPSTAGTAPDTGEAPVLVEMQRALAEIEQRPPLELYHELSHGLRQARSLFNHGLLGLAERAAAERLYNRAGLTLRQRLDPAQPAEAAVRAQLQGELASKYFCNLSIFQSLPDIWAIKQVFPILPLQRLQERPEMPAVLHDLTCDSDGRIDRYVADPEFGMGSALPLHRPGESRYLLGFFLVGAYQEILGDMHNLFGDADSVNVRLHGEDFTIDDPEPGDTAGQLLAYVHFDPDRMRTSYRAKINRAGVRGAAAEHYLQMLSAGLHSHTYLRSSA